MRTPKEDLPERIYLLPDFYDGIEGYTWCDDPNPSGEYAPDEVQAYVKESSRSPGCYPVLNDLLSKDFFRPTLQTRFDEKGNCLNACIATLFDVGIDEVPCFGDKNENWIFELSNWMRGKFGKYVCSVKFQGDDQAALLGESLTIAIINSPNPKVERHAVITQSYRIVFDPMCGEVDEPITDKHDATFLLIGDVRSVNR